MKLVKKDEGFLYIYLHLQKCGGTTIRHHLENNIDKKKLLKIDIDYYNFKIFNNNDQFSIKDYFSLSLKNKLEAKELAKNQIREYLEKLTIAEKNEIRVIYGDGVPYGIHKLFNRKVRYITILRNPSDRIVSSYNYLVTQYNNDVSNKYSHLFDGNILRDKRVITLNEFVDRSYDNQFLSSPSVSMINLLEALGYLNNENGQTSAKSIRNCLDTFYFVGDCKNIDNDLMYIYYKLGVSKFFNSLNVSKKYAKDYDVNMASDLIRRKSQDDDLLYTLGRMRLMNFRKSNSDFYRIVFYMRIKKISQRPLLYVYKLSDVMKKCVPFWETFIGFVKNRLNNKLGV